MSENEKQTGEQQEGLDKGANAHGPQTGSAAGSSQGEQRQG